MNIGIIPFAADPAHVAHRWRYDVLIKSLPEFGHTAGYWDENKKYDAVIVPITIRNERAFDSLHGAGIPLIGDSVDDVLSFPYSNYLLPGRIYYHLRLNIIENQFSRLSKMITKCKRVVVGSTVLHRRFMELNKDSAVIADAITDDILSFGANCEQANPCRIAWFGNVASLHGFRAMGQALDILAGETGYELVVITSGYTQGRYLGKKPRTAKDFIAGQKIPCRLVNWDYNTFLAEIANCHIGIVPVECDGSFSRAKPPGRTLLMMGMGLAVVASPVESHIEAIQEGVTGFIARNPQDWVRAIKLLGASAELRKSVGLSASRFVKDNFSEKVFVKKYLAVIETL